MMNEPNRPEARGEDRRGFLRRAASIVIGSILSLVPLGAGLTVLFDPLRKRAQSSGLVRVTSLDALPDDGVPRRFQVITTKVDAWNKFPDTPVGAVYLRRQKGGTIQALNAVCPHAGCFVEFLADRGMFLCPCHLSSFNVAGAIENRSSPASRGLDSLEVEIKGGTEVWVKFQNFQAGRPDKVPVA